MADTQRTLSAALALLADNATGDISPQDLRDTVVSIFANHALIGVAGGSTAQTGISAIPAKVTGFATDGLSSGCITAAAASDKLTVTVAGTYLLVWSCSFYGTSGKAFLGEIYAGGSPVTLGRWRATVGTSPAVSNAVAVGTATLAASADIEGYVSSPDGTSFTPVDMVLAAIKIA